MDYWGRVGEGGGAKGILAPHSNYCGSGKNHKYTKLKGKIIINVTLISFEGTDKTIPLNSTILSMNFL